MLRTSIYLATYTLSLLHAKPLTNHPTTIQATTKGCEYQGQLYSAGERFNEGTDGQGWCHGLYCSHSGDVVAWDNFNCGTTTSPTTTKFTKPKSATPEANKPKPTTPKVKTPETTNSSLPKSTARETNTPSSILPSTSPPVGCEYGGNFFYPGEVIEKGFNAELSWCYGTNCTDDGHILAWDNFDCSFESNATPTTTELATTFQSTTTPNNVFSNTPTTAAPPTTLPSTLTPNDIISNTTKQTSTSPPLTTTGNLSTPNTTTQPSTSQPPPTIGCTLDGKFYYPGEEIDNRIMDSEARRCSRVYCRDGVIVNSDCTILSNSTNTTPKTIAPVYPLLFSNMISYVLIITSVH